MQRKKRTKLTQADADLIRKLVKEEALLTHELAELFDVNPRTIGNILNGRTFKEKGCD